MGGTAHVDVDAVVQPAFGKGFRRSGHIVRLLAENLDQQALFAGMTLQKGLHGAALRRVGVTQRADHLGGGAVTSLLEA